MKALRIIALLSTVALLSAAITYVVVKAGAETNQSAEKPKGYASLRSTGNGSCDLSLVRLNSKNLVRPLLFADAQSESDELLPIKARLLNQIDSLIQSGRLLRSSVYLKALNSPDWIAINGEDGYHPGSMLKIGVLITWLASIDKDPSILNKGIQIRANVPVEVTTVSGNRLVVGQSYSIADLLTYMIVDSNNEATAALIDNMNSEEFKRLFRELQMEVPDLSNMATVMNPVHFARLLRVLYNGTYLSRKNSEYALNLMSKAAFRGGLVKYIPEEVPVAHKFGERFSDAGQQFHEAGVVYTKNNPYVIVIMTEGKDKRVLPEAVALLSKTVFDALN
jgi:beta-lactamase class A